MPSWGTVATNKEHSNFLQENSKITLAFYFHYLRLRKFSHFILDNILNFHPYSTRVQFGWIFREE